MQGLWTRAPVLGPSSRSLAAGKELYGRPSLALPTPPPVKGFQAQCFPGAAGGRYAQAEGNELEVSAQDRQQSSYFSTKIFQIKIVHIVF